jgi:hypothetical protein
MDRMDSKAIFTYKDQILDLLSKPYIIYDIAYEIAVYDEIDFNPGITPYPPSSALPKDARRVRIATADGITTNPSTLGNDIHVRANEALGITAFSKSEITAETVTLHNIYAPYDELVRKGGPGISVVNNGNGSYTITVKQIDAEMIVNVMSVTSTSSGLDVGNAVIASDAVWAASGLLNVKSLKPATLSVYTVTGQLFKQVQVRDSYSMTLPKGLYIIQLNGKAYKVLN